MVGIRSDDAIIEGIFTERLHALRIAEAGGNDVITVLGNVFIREDELGYPFSVVKVSASLFYWWQVLIDNKRDASLRPGDNLRGDIRHVEAAKRIRVFEDSRLTDVRCDDCAQ